MTLPQITELFNFHSKIVATKAIKTVRYLVAACQNQSEVAEVLTAAMPNLLKTIKLFSAKEDAKRTHHVLKQISKSLGELTEPAIAENTIADLINSLSEALSFCDQEKKKIIEGSKGLEDLDDEKKEEIEDEYEEVNELMQVVMEISGKLLKIYRERVEGVIANSIAPYYYNFFNGSSFASSEVLYAICLFDDLLENSSMTMFEKAAPEATKKFIEYCKNPDTNDILHSAVYGLGVISKRINRESFKQIKGEILQAISGIVTAQDAFSQEKASLTENAIGALGKVALYQSEQNDKISEEVLLKFLKFLPLKNDVEEAQAVHKMLLEEVLNKNETLMYASQDVQNALMQAISGIVKSDSNNPESEMLDDEGKRLADQVLNSLKV